MTSKRAAAISLAAIHFLLASCSTSPEVMRSGGTGEAGPSIVEVSELPDGQLQLFFGPVPPSPAHEVLGVEDAEAVLAAFNEEFEQLLASQPPPIVLAGGRRRSEAAERAAWEEPLRARFVSKYGPPLLPMPEVLERSRLYMALKLSPRYMAPGVREAAQELFKSPVFRASVALSMLVYLVAWTVPEPLFSKTFAAAMTVRLAMVVTLLELRNVALACLQLYREAEAARTLEELEAVAERFGRALGGVGLRVLVMVASSGVAKALPPVPPGGMWTLMGPPRYAAVGGLVLGRVTTAHAVADGTLVVAGAAVGTATSSISRGSCADGSQKKDGYQWHHLATNKNRSSTAQGGPWTPLFEEIFSRAGLRLEAGENRVYLRTHQGPHPQEYHEEVFRRLQQALGSCRTTQQCRDKLVQELKRIASDVCDPGARLNRLLTQSPR